MKIKIAIIDDHNLFRKGLQTLFETNEDYEVIIEAESGTSFIKKLGIIESFPDIILLDLKMPKMNGLQCLAYLEKHHPDHKTIVLSMFDDSPFVIKSLKAGAKGYLLKNADPEELFRAIRQVIEKGLYMNQHLSESLVKNIKGKKSSQKISAFDPTSLNNMELEVLTYICQGYTNQEISEIVHRSSRTIEGHRQKLINKTRSKNTASLVAWAFRRGLVE